MDTLWRCSLVVGVVCCISCVSALAKVSSVFVCPDLKFKCGSSEKCIPHIWKCDGDDDCGDGSDESTDCTPKTCRPEHEFACGTDKCIPKRWHCDNEKDCADGSDEVNCPKPTCRPNFFQCKNARCIPERWKCDKQDDCGDTSDEPSNCPGSVRTCSSNEFKCTDGVCLTKSWHCDGDNDCADGSDEQNCNKTAATCKPKDFRCKNKQCIKKDWRCDGNDDCFDRSDEAGCPTIRARTTCGAAFWQCRNGDCINKRWHCDGENDCLDGSDEHANCTDAVCQTEQFACLIHHQCIDKSLRCNEQIDCSDGTDEMHCRTSTTNCTANDFNCTVSGECVSMDQVCNGRKDCLKGEDEAHNCNINECLDNNGHCTHACTDLKIGYKCTCPKGFQLDADRRSCQDVDECKEFGSCHQICENKKGDFICRCANGYILEPDRKTCRAAGSSKWVYFSNRVDIRKISSDGRDYRIVVGGLRGVVSIDFHIKKKHIYWTDILTDQIQRASIDGKYSVEAEVIHTNVHTPDGLAVDWINDKLYWTDTGYKTIEVSELNGTNNADLVNVGLAEPRAICLDPFEGFIYWTDWGSYAAIERISMDGDNTTRQILVQKNVYWPNGLTLDLIQRKLYWIDAKLQRVEAVNLDGTKRRIIKGTGFVHPFALDNFEDQLYWTDWKSDKLSSISKFNSSNVNTIKDGLFAPMGIKVYHESKQVDGVNRCAVTNHRCSHMCLLANRDGKPSIGCACPRNMTLLDGKTCIGVHKPRTTPPGPTRPKPPPVPTRPKVVTTMLSPTTRSMSQSTSQVITTQRPPKAKTFTTLRTITKVVVPPKTEKKPPKTEKIPPKPEKKQPKTEEKPHITRRPHVVVPHVDPVVLGPQKSQVKPQAHGVSAGTLAAIILSIIVVLILAFALLMYLKRRKLSKGNVMLYYKDMSMTPLEDDFDIENEDMDEKEKIIPEYVVS